VNPQVTMTRPLAINPQFMIASSLTARTIKHESRNPIICLVPREETKIDAAERDRQDSLVFLHTLVMG
jgi:hypothetical protein